MGVRMVKRVHLFTSLITFALGLMTGVQCKRETFVPAYAMPRISRTMSCAYVGKVSLQRFFCSDLHFSSDYTALD